MWYQPVLHTFVYIPSGITSTGHLACFDLDFTLIRPHRGTFPANPADIVILPRRKEILSDLIQNHTLIVFTNQLSRNENQRMASLQRINNFVTMIEIPIIVVVSTARDHYRKPDIGMWELLRSMIDRIDSAFYCGDAAGRPQDFSSSDRQFAYGVEIPFYLPEEIFLGR